MLFGDVPLQEVKRGHVLFIERRLDQRIDARRHMAFMLEHLIEQVLDRFELVNRFGDRAQFRIGARFADIPP